MKVSSAAAAATLLAAAEAIIVGFAAPKTIRPGDNFTLTIITENYIQAVGDVSGAVGYIPGRPFPESLGFLLGEFYLGPAKSNVLGNLTQVFQVPEHATLGNNTLAASFMSLWGAFSSPMLSFYNVTVEFGSETSEELVRSN